MRTLIFASLISAAALGACDGAATNAERPPLDREPSYDFLPAPTAPPDTVDPGRPFAVPADPEARYAMIDVRDASGVGYVTALSRRTGSSGVSYTLREMDCVEGLVRTIGEGPTEEVALIAADAWSAWTPVFSLDTSAGAAWAVACPAFAAQFRRGLPE